MVCWNLKHSWCYRFSWMWLCWLFRTCWLHLSAAQFSTSVAVVHLVSTSPETCECIPCWEISSPSMALKRTLLSSIFNRFISFFCCAWWVQLLARLWAKDFARLSQNDPGLIETPPARTVRGQMEIVIFCENSVVSFSVARCSPYPVPRPLLNLLLHPTVLSPLRL